MRKLFVTAALFNIWLLTPISADAQMLGAMLVNRMDSDGDGRVSKSEFRGRRLPFDQIDLDGDGYATEEEFDKAIRRARGNRSSGRSTAQQQGSGAEKIRNGDDYISIETRPGGSFRVELYPTDNAKATILMFEGSGGNFKPGGKGFVSGQYDEFASFGIAVAVMTPPDDNKSFQGGMPPSFRESRSHTKDIGTAVQELKKRFKAPVWLLGISMGSKSLATFLAHRSNMIDGAVFISSSTRPPGGFKSVTDYEFSNVRAPVLAVAHEDDGCKGTPPEGADEIVQLMTQSSAAKTLKFSGGTNTGRSPCRTNTHHTFAGIEHEVVSAIAGFIGENTQ